MKNIFAILVAATVLTGCGATGPKFSGFTQPSEGQSKVYVYRNSSMNGGGIHYDVHANELLIGHLRNGGYIEKELPPGSYEIWGETETKRGVVVDLKPNAIQCVATKIGFGILMGRPKFALVDMEQCKREIPNTNLSM